MTQTLQCPENEDLSLDGFDRFVRDQSDAVRQNWRQASDTFPDLGEPVPLSKQGENERAAARLIDRVSAALCTYPEHATDRLPWRSQLLEEIDTFVANHCRFPLDLVGYQLPIHDHAGGRGAVPFFHNRFCLSSGTILSISFQSIEQVAEAAAQGRPP